MKIRLSLWALLVAFAWSPALHAAEPWKLPRTKEECVAKNGGWEKRGMPGDPQAAEICVIDAPDAGKSCKSQVQCLSGWCRPKPKGGWKPAGEKAPGVCEAFMPVNGCVQGLNKGIIFDVPCVM